MGLMVVMVWGYVRKFGVEASLMKGNTKKKVCVYQHLPSLSPRPMNENKSCTCLGLYSLWLYVCTTVELC